MALPKKNRIKNKKEIDRVFKNGKTVRSSFLFIRFMENQKGYPRFVFIVPSRCLSLAVDRNRIKRIFSEEIIKSGILVQWGYDAAVSVFRKTERSQFPLLRKEFKDILTRISKN